ncbi:O-antigen polymerase [Solibacillus sp. FSL H8-0523]|uniref:O-antigen polymerase n=1 Tax=Solibacillus sp. FSL H8-0523 TaxID=2954511 RepID=UPI0031016399
MERSIGLKYVTLLMAICLSSVGIYFTDSVLMNIIYFCVLPIIAVVLVRGDLAHPYTWYSIVYTLYAIGYPVTYLFESTYDIYIYTKSLMLVQIIALSIILVIVGPTRISFHKNVFKLAFEKRNKTLFYVVLILVSMSVLEVIFKGYSHKVQIYEQGSPIVQIGFRVILLLMIIYAINQTITFIKNEKFNNKELFAFILITFGIFYYSGERDLFLRGLIVILFLYYIFSAKQKINLLTIIMGISSLLLIPLMAKFKYFGLTGNVSKSDGNFLLSLFNSEFASASKNLQIILLSEYNSYFGGQSYIWGIIRGLNLDSIFTAPSIMSWYNSTFFEENRAGQGFSILAEGYLNNGYSGIVFIAVSIGLIMKLLYRTSKINVYFFVYYLSAIPIFMYSLRADLANLLTPLIGQNLLFLVLLLIFNSLSREFKIITKRKNKSKQVIVLEKVGKCGES